MTRAGTINCKLSSLRHFVVVCLPKIPWHYWENIAFLPWTERIINTKKAVDVGWREQCCSSVGFHRWMESLVNAIRSICYDTEKYMKCVLDRKSIWFSCWPCAKMKRTRMSYRCLTPDCFSHVNTYLMSCMWYWSSWWDLRNYSELTT